MSKEKVSFRISKEKLEQLEQLVDDDVFDSRSQLLRHSVDEFLDNSKRATLPKQTGITRRHKVRES